MSNGIGPFEAVDAIFKPSSGAVTAVPGGPFRPSEGVGVTPPLLTGAPLEVLADTDAPGLTDLEAGGNILAVAGLVTAAIGSFYQAESQKTQLKSQALSLDFQQNIANINARAAEQDAAAIFAAGRRRLAQITLRFGQVRGAQVTATAARGIQAGVGSAAEVAASIRLATIVDALTIDANTLRGIQAARRRQIQFENQALLAGVSARNVRGSERSISPGLQAFTTLLGGAGGVASGIAQRSRFPGAAGVPRTPGVTTQRIGGRR
jgi:hypothetical protein